MDEKKVNLSENLRFLREKKRYTQGRMAEFMDISQQAYCNIEQNPEKTSLKNIREIAKILGVNVCTLIMEDGQKTQLNIDQSGGNAILADNVSTSESTDKLVEVLKEEIAFLRKNLEQKLDPSQQLR